MIVVIFFAGFIVAVIGILIIHSVRKMFKKKKSVCPGMPQGPLKAFNIGFDAVELAWLPPEYDGGSCITNYILEWKETKDTVWHKTVIPVEHPKMHEETVPLLEGIEANFTSNITYTVLGLINGTNYSFQVRAKNAKGEGAPLVMENTITTKTDSEGNDITMKNQQHLSLTSETMASAYEDKFSVVDLKETPLNVPLRVDELEKQSKTLESKLETQDRDILCRFQEDIRMLEMEKKDVTSRLNDSNQQARNLELELSELKHRATDHEKEKRQLEDRLDTSKAAIQKLEANYGDAQNRIGDLEKQNKMLENKLSELRKEKHGLDGILGKTEDNFRKAELESKDATRRLNDSEEQARKLERKVKKSIKKATEHENQSEQLKDQLNKSKAVIKRLEAKNNDAESRLDDAKSKREYLMEKLKEAEAKSSHLLNEKEGLRLRCNEADGQRHRLETFLRDSEDKVRRLEQEKDDLLTRLSQYTSAQLVQDNPNVADLSDLNRPTKIAEKFSELFDNDWTDAFEVLMEQFSFTEEEAIKHLLNIVLMTFSYCKDAAEKQVKMLKKALIRPIADQSPMSSSLKLDAVQLRMIHDLRKQTSEQSMESVKKGLIQHMKTTKLGAPDPDHIKPYVEKCTELCWYMMLPSPPLYVSPPELSGDSFDKNKYRYYQNSGKRYKFFVWPTLYLYKDGNMLAKGIAEGM